MIIVAGRERLLVPGRPRLGVAVAVAQGMGNSAASLEKGVAGCTPRPTMSREDIDR